MGLKAWVLEWLGIDVTDSVKRERAERLEELREYYEGRQKQQLRVKPNKFDDNLTINLCGLIVDKAVSALVGDPADGRGLTWTFPSEAGEGTPKSIAWLNAQWELNKQEIFLHKNALQGAESGFPCVKLVPDGAGNIRLINLNPLLVAVETGEQDADRISAYVISYNVTEDNKQVQYREITNPLAVDDIGNPISWLVALEKKISGRRWELIESVQWPYPFPPIHDWQNLPATDSRYGRSDIEGIIGIQDRYNFLVSNISKIIRLFAHPQRYGKNLSAQMTVDPKNGQSEFVMGPDEMPMFSGDGEINQLPPVGDLPGAMLFLQSLRESAFVLSREVDTASMKDRVGAITNFALRVLYRDFLDKLGTKRMLYGQAYQELNRRMLVLGGFEPETCIINWPDPLPVNEQEVTASLQADMAMGIVDKQTAAEVRGYDWEQVQERMNGEKMNSDNVGAILLNDFFKNGGNRKVASGESA